MTKLRAIGLTARQAKYLALWAYDCLEPSEIAEQEGVSKQAVCATLARGQAKIEAAGLVLRRMIREEPISITTLDPYEIDNIDPAIIVGSI